MLDHRQIKENPVLIEQALSRRGLNIELSSLTKDIDRLKTLEQKRNQLQAQGNSIGLSDVMVPPS